MSEAAPLDLPRPGRQAGVDPHSIPLDEIDVSDVELFTTDTLWGYFERLRKEDPVHYCAESAFGPYWSVTKFDDIVHVEKNPEIFSSDPNVSIVDPPPDALTKGAGFISMDGPRHDAHRKVVQPVASPRNLRHLEPLVRERVARILDGLPIGETFNWVDRVSIELTTGMLATMFDFPWEDRRKLTFWSDMMTASAAQLAAMGKTQADRRAALLECLDVFQKLWDERKGKQADKLDFVSALANAEATRDIDPITYLGTLILLIVGGNDTTRNSISGGVLALNQYPDEYEKLRNDPGLIPNMVNEIIRWQTPLAHMRRTATRDTELGGKRIKKGDKVVMWYVSANRDETAIERANEFLIDRKNSKQHLSFGWGVHFCMGSRMAEMQLRVLWEECIARFREVEVVGEPVRVASCFVKGIQSLPVRVHPW
ncbi:MAG TPA: cytochrome P450 [Deltaproteobacteria bacterium]|nr:cytochrome P450 [Deltaproteobacteria bacterium]